MSARAMPAKSTADVCALGLAQEIANQCLQRHYYNARAASVLVAVTYPMGAPGCAAMLPTMNIELSSQGASEVRQFGDRLV